MMRRYKAHTVAEGWASGIIRLFRRGPRPVRPYPVKDIREEKKRYECAREKCMRQLQELYTGALREVGELGAEEILAQRRLLQSTEYNEAVGHILTGQEVNAEYAVATVGKNMEDMYRLSDEEEQGRKADRIREVTDRLLDALDEHVPWSEWKEEGIILAADRLLPQETAQLDTSRIRGLLLTEESAHSHGAMLARSLGIPALSGIGLSEAWDGKEALLCGEKEGWLILEPEPEQQEEMKTKQREKREKKRLLEELKGKDDITPGGRRIRLYAGIAGLGELSEVLSNDGAGIGLFRSEFLYLNRRDEPTEEEQFRIYRQLAENMAGRPVFIRTADLGSDKRRRSGLAWEENPAMGLRGIRYALEHPTLLRTQLRAIFRAAAYGDIALLYPMLTSMEELVRLRKIEEAVKAELKAEEILCPDIPRGIMIETPAAALISDALAPETDFFCIGMNDLMQFVLAADRRNPKVEGLFDVQHPAVLRLLRQIIENAHRGGAWVMISGDCCETSEMTALLLKMGIDGFCVPPAQLLPMRQKIRSAAE